jgi:hypothetical protein
MKTEKTITTAIAFFILAFASMAQAQTSNELWLGIGSQSSNIIVTVYAPTNVNPDFDDAVEIYRSTDLIAGTWEIATSNLYPVKDVPKSWTNDNAGTVGFFVAGNADIDSDGDTLPDARESYVSKTSPYREDTDGDGEFDAVDLNARTSSVSIIYVSTTGSDDYDGTYYEHTGGTVGPKPDILEALNVATNIVYIVDQGNYTGTVWRITNDVDRVRLTLGIPTVNIMPSND